MPRHSRSAPRTALALLTLPWLAACQEPAASPAATARLHPVALSATTAATGPTAGRLESASTHERALLVLHHGGLHAVLTTVQEVAGPVTPRLTDAEHNVVLVEASAVPGTFASLLGTTLQLQSDAGEACTAEVVGFDYRAEIIPDGVLLDAMEENPASPEDLAFQLWDAAAEKQLVARLRPVGERCDGTPLVAYAEDVNAVAGSERAMTATQRAQALAAFRALRAYRAHQFAYEQEVSRDPEGLWPERWEDDGHELSLQAFSLHDGSTLLSVSAPYVGCRGFDLSLWATFREGEDGRPVLLQTTSEIPVYGVHGVITLDGDTRFDFVVDEGLGTRSLVRDGARAASAGAEFHGCPC